VSFPTARRSSAYRDVLGPLSPEEDRDARAQHPAGNFRADAENWREIERRAVRTTVEADAEPLRRSDDSYRLENRFRYLIAVVP
jgi:hypothetical protein